MRRGEGGELLGSSLELELVGQSGLEVDFDGHAEAEGEGEEHGDDVATNIAYFDPTSEGVKANEMKFLFSSGSDYVPGTIDRSKTEDL